MSDLAHQLGGACGAAFASLGLDAALGAVRRSDRPDLADFQCNGAMPAAKAARRNPREIASEIAGLLQTHEDIADVTVAGPGFLNIIVTDAALSRHARAIGAHEQAGVLKAETTQKVVIDFGGPNVAKPMHVGHLRSAVIGDTLKRLGRALGHEVTGDAHLGDWGLQMGQLIVALNDEQPGLVYFNESHDGPFPSASPVTIEDLATLYPAASARAKTDAAYKARCQQATAELQAGRAGYRALLVHFIAVSIAALKVDYARLNVSFDLWKGESDVDPLIPDMVADLKARGIAIPDDGAWVVPVARDTDKGKTAMPPLILVNSRGASGYHATDLATILDRSQGLKPDVSLYVVDQRQALHFEQVFRAADTAGYMPEESLEHIGFGTVNGPDGKPFKTRAGGTMRLSDLNDMALKAATARLQNVPLSADISEGERARIAAQIALAAIRFSDLQNVRTTNYMFDLEKFTSFEGKTGPYLLYAAVRIKSVLRKAKEAGDTAGTIAIEHAAERALALQLDAFAQAVEQSFDKRMPHILCEHVFSLAQAFSAFYGAHPIATEPDAGVRGSRLALSAAVLHQLETGLDLLGIDIPDRM